MLKQIDEIKKLLTILEEGMVAASKPPLNEFELMTDKEMIMYLATRCNSFEVPLSTLLKLEIITRTKEC